MDTNLAALFYLGIIVPTLITISVFIGFLLCLYKRNIRKTTSAAHQRALPSTPILTPNRRSIDKFDKYSEHSADSAIDVGDVENGIEEKFAAGGLLLDTKSLERGHHSYQNEGMLLITEAEIHGATLRKGHYPSQQKLNEEIHSQVKIYEKMSDVQRVALLIQRKRESLRPSEKRLVASAQLQQADKTASRYTSASKLVPAASPTNSNQLDTAGGNYAAYSPSWYAVESTDSNNHNMDIYKSHYPSSAASWRPNITAASCSSNTDNYSSVESSQV